MGQWLIADLSVSDVHFQLWMLLEPISKFPIAVDPL